MTKTYELIRETEIDGPLERIFPFFADAQNLEAITPPWLHFKILSPLPIDMKAGALIHYRLRLLGVPFSWTTRITAWEPPTRFVDEQLSGPFRSWVHEHTFESHNGRTLARDHVRYQVPGGALVNRLFVRRDLERIFDHRQKVLRRLADPLRDRTEAALTAKERPSHDRSMQQGI
jgi:ligand-binding SRPBCC domain-containing protein